MGRAPCCDKSGMKKGPWTPEEDEKLMQFIQAHGPGNWRSLPKNAGLERCGKSCRLRWTNYLRPDIKRGRFSFEEEETIIQLHSIMGNKWSAIAARLPGRTDNEIKNYWNTHIRKRLLRMGIDPVTHIPRLDLLDISSILTSSLYNNDNINVNNNNTSLLNLSSLIGLASQPYLSPQLLNLATTLLSIKQETQNYHQNPQETQLYNPQIQNQFLPPLVDQFQNQVSSNLDQTQLMQPPNSMQQTLVCAMSSPRAHDPLENSSIETMHDSSPLSGVAPPDSSSNFINSSNEDERESYCSSWLKFDIPESFDISEFL